MPGLSLLFLLLFQQLSAQEWSPDRRVYLEGGGFIHGQFIAKDSSGWSTYRLRSGEEIRLPQSSIVRVKESNDHELVFKKGRFVTTKGYYFTFHVGTLFGYSDGDDSELVTGVEFFSLSFGHQYNPHWQVGGGVAFDVYDHEFLPLFAEVRCYPWPKMVSPYFSLQTGYAPSFALFDSFNNNYGGGPMIHPAAGLRFAHKRKGNFLLEAGYRFQWGRNESPRVTDKLLYRRLALRFGWEF